MIIDIPSNLKLPPNFLYNKGVSGRFNVEFESDFDAVVYFAGKSPLPKGKTQKPLMEWLMSLGISFDDIKNHRNKILDVIRQLTDIDQSSNYVTVPPIPQSFSVKSVKDKKEEIKLEEKQGLEENKNLDALLDSIRNEESEEKNLDALLDSIRNEKPEDKKIDPDKLLSVKTFKNPLKGQKFTAPVIKSSVKNIKEEQLKPVIRIEPEKLIPDDKNASEEIIGKLDELIAVIKADNALEKDQQDYIKKQEEKKKREKREERIEGIKKFLGTVGKKVLNAAKPITDFFKTLKNIVIFGAINSLIDSLYGFFTNPENKKKIENAADFLKTWWPALAVAAGAALIPFKGLIAVIGGVAIKGLLLASKLLIANPLVAAAIIGTGAVIALLKKSQSKDPLDEEGRRRSESAREFGGDTGASEPFSGLFNSGGGMIPSFGTDTVPAMLTPGEIVMSRPAVNYWGADNLLAMNKAGGGTNRPKYGLISGYQGGGFVDKMGVTGSQFEIYKKSVGDIESKGSGGYSARGGANNHYDGKYQMGEVAKKDAARYLGEPFPGHDPAAREAFRADPEMQERYFKAYTYANYNYMLKDPTFKSASPERKLAILGYAHNQGWAKALDWLNTGEVGRDAFGTAGTKYVDAIEEAFKIRGSAPPPPILPPPGLPDEGKTELEKVGDNFKFIFDSIRNLLPVGTPNVPTSSKIIVLPPIKQQVQQPTTTQTSNEIPDFKVSSGVKMRGLVGKALGIEDLVS